MNFNLVILILFKRAEFPKATTHILQERLRPSWLEVVLANGYFENLALKNSQFQMPFIYLINGHWALCLGSPSE